MSEHMSPIPSRIYNAAVGGHVAGADQIIDDETGLTLDKVAGGALEEKTYTSGSNNGMGRVVLRKNLVNGVNTLTQNMINKSNTIYVIQYDFTLGEDITVPANCVLEFDGGSISGEYLLTFSDTYITGSINSIKSSVAGTILNDIVHSGWFNNDEDIILSAILSCCVNSRTFYFDKGTYTFTKDICIYNGIVLDGNNEAFINFDYDNTGKIGYDSALCGIMCGTKRRGETNPYERVYWYGKMRNLNIACVGSTTAINSLVYLCAVRDCIIENNKIDVSQNQVTLEGANGIICRKNNAAFALPLDCHDFVIRNNTLICDTDEYSYASTSGYSSESIGIVGADNVVIRDNHILRSSDDLGIHNCNNVIIENNNITTWDGRIYMSGCTDSVIRNNILSVENNSMGIVIERELSNIVAKNILIEGNHIFNVNGTPYSYGIRIRYGKNISILNNVVSGGNIVIEETDDTIQDDQLTADERVADKVNIVGNKSGGIDCRVRTVGHNCIIANNYVDTHIVMWGAGQMYGNVMGANATTFQVLNTEIAQSLICGCIDFIADFNNASHDAEFWAVLPDGEIEIEVPFRFSLMSFMAMIPNDYTLAVGYIILQVYINGTNVANAGAGKGVKTIVTNDLTTIYPAGTKIKVKGYNNNAAGDVYTRATTCRLGIINIDKMVACNMNYSPLSKYFYSKAIDLVYNL